MTRHPPSGSGPPYVCPACGRPTLHRADCPVFLQTVIATLVGVSTIAGTLVVASILGHRLFIDVVPAVVVFTALVIMLAVAVAARRKDH